MLPAFLEKARLTEARLTNDDDDRAPARFQVPQCRAHQSELALAPNKKAPAS